MDNQRIEYVTYIRTPPDKLWSALTQGESTRRYFLGYRVASDWTVGAPVTFTAPDGRVEIRGEVLACDPPRRLTFSWQPEPAEGEETPCPPTHLSFLLEPLGEMVRLTALAEHPEPVPEECVEGERQGLPMIVSGLKSLLETGSGLPLPGEKV